MFIAAFVIFLCTLALLITLCMQLTLTVWTIIHTYLSIHNTCKFMFAYICCMSMCIFLYTCSWHHMSYWFRGNIYFWVNMMNECDEWFMKYLICWLFYQLMSNNDNKKKLHLQLYFFLIEHSYHILHTVCTNKTHTHTEQYQKAPSDAQQAFLQY